MPLLVDPIQLNVMSSLFKINTAFFSTIMLFFSGLVLRRGLENPIS